MLSTGKYRRLVQHARSLGFQIHVIYVLLDSADRNVERVRLRVMKGGHDVPEDKIRARHARSLAQIPWFLDHADRASLYDNTGAQPRLVGEKADGSLIIDPAAPADLVAALTGTAT